MLANNSSFSRDSKEVDSFYFSLVNHQYYNELKQNDFLPVKPDEIANLKTKKKLKVMMKPKLD